MILWHKTKTMAYSSCLSMEDGPGPETSCYIYDIVFLNIQKGDSENGNLSLQLTIIPHI